MPYLLHPPILTVMSKCQRMSTDSASEPPSSAVSFSSYNDGYSSQFFATSYPQRLLMDFPFDNYPHTISLAVRGTLSSTPTPWLLLETVR